MRVLGKNNHKDVVAEARNKFKAHASGGEQISADLRTAVYATVLTHGDEATFDEMLKVRLVSRHKSLLPSCFLRDQRC